MDTRDEELMLYIESKLTEKERERLYKAWEKWSKLHDKNNQKKKLIWWRETLKEVAICIALGTLIGIVALIVMWFGHLVF